MDRKYYVMGGSLIAVLLVLLLSVALLSSCSKKGSYTQLENKLVAGAKKMVANGDVTIEVGSNYTATADELVSAGYVKSLEKIKDDGCTGSVLIMNNGGVYNYMPTIVCNNYKTATLKQQIIDDNLTTSKDGLYYVNGEYIFKGKEPNNHLTFADEDWLIIKIDANGNLKLINTNAAAQNVQWDDKFNEVTNSSSGESDYESSKLYRILANKYEGFGDNVKKHLIPFSACVGARDPLDLTINLATDCAKTVDNQYVSVINMSDYVFASYDKDCNDMLAGSCMNYNYFKNYVDETWTLNTLSDSTYEVLLLQGTKFTAVSANEVHKYFDVVYISGNEIYTSGDGSEKNPYVVK